MRKGTKHSAETRAVLSKQRIGNKFCAGRKLSKSAIEAIRQANLGKNNVTNGRTLCALCHRTTESFGKNL